MLALIPWAPFTFQFIAIWFLPFHFIETALVKDNFKVVKSNRCFCPFFSDSPALDNIATFSFSKLSLNRYTSFALCHHSYLVFLSHGLILLETFHYLLNLRSILCYILKLRKSCEIDFQKVPRILPFLITPLKLPPSSWINDTVA